MSHKHSHRPPPRWALLSALGLISVALLSAMIGRFEAPDRAKPTAAFPTARVALLFGDRPDGAVIVKGAESRKTIEVLMPGTGGFVRTVVRAMAQERLRQGQGRDIPFELTRWSDGRLTILDPATRRSINLNAFGMTNANSFVRLLNIARTRRQAASERDTWAGSK